MLGRLLSIFRRATPAKTPEMVTLEERLAAAEARITRENRQYEDRLRDRRSPGQAAPR